jgi:RNA polymerase sigma-70 factor, ECF subfamily
MTVAGAHSTHAFWRSAPVVPNQGRSIQERSLWRWLSGIDTRAKWLNLTSFAEADRSRVGRTMVALEELRGDAKSIAVSMADCIARIADSKDEASFETVFRYFAPRLKSYFMRLGADVSVAEEITQEAMVQVWRNAGQFDLAKASASTWIFTLARNLSIDKFRRTRRPSFDPSDPAFIPDGEMLPDLQLERAETERRVRVVMNSLSPNEKSVLMLSFYENFSHGEIAERLGIPLGTVKSRIRLAFARIRTALETRQGEEQ